MVHPHSNLTRIVDNLIITTDALAAVTGVVGTGKIDATRLNGYRTLSQRGYIRHRNSDGAGGPIMVGFAQAGMDLSEIEEAIEADPQSMVDQPATEQAARLYYLLGYLNGGSDLVSTFKAFNTRHKASYIEGASLPYFVYNTSTGVALDASNDVQIFCEHLGVWLRD